MKTKVIGIMACASNGIIGRNGVIPWRYPDEISHFRSVIGNHPIVIGRKTFESMPKIILKNRISVVFSRTRKDNIPNVIFVSSIDDFFALDIVKKATRIFMIGGAEIANYFLAHNLLSKFILTKIKNSYIGDAYLNINAFDYWKSEVINKTSNYNIYKLTTNHNELNFSISAKS